MWISKKRWKDLEKRVADLEEKIEDQPVEEIADKLAKRLEDAIDSFSHTPQE